MADDSVLADVKRMLGIQKEDEHFDCEIILHINSALTLLTQIGLGPSEGFVITGYEEQWEDFIGDLKDRESIKVYVYFKVRLGFDAPSNSFLVDAIENQIKELEWRLNVIAENKQEG